jgi:hypothetical protein
MSKLKKTKIRKTRKNMQKGGDPSVNIKYEKAIEKYSKILGKLPPFVTLSSIIPKVGPANINLLIVNLTNKASNYPNTITNEEQINEILYPVVADLLKDIINKGGITGYLAKQVDITKVFSDIRKNALLTVSQPNDLIPALIEDLEVFKGGKNSNDVLPPRFKFKDPLPTENNKQTSSTNNGASSTNNGASSTNNGASSTNNGASSTNNGASTNNKRPKRNHTYLFGSQESPTSRFNAEAGSRKIRKSKRYIKRRTKKTYAK